MTATIRTQLVAVMPWKNRAKLVINVLNSKQTAQLL